MPLADGTPPTPSTRRPPDDATTPGRRSGMTIRQLFYALLLGAALWAAVIGFGVAVYSCEGEAVADPSPSRPASFKTPLEADLWYGLASCRGELEVAARKHALDLATCEARLEGERAKVRTATTTINLACPVIPPCPAIPSGEGLGPWSAGTLGGGIGVLAGFLACSAIRSGSPDVVIAR